MCAEVLVVTGNPTDEVYRCERHKKRHRKHRARVTGADRDGEFVAVVTWWRIRRD